MDLSDDSQSSLFSDLSESEYHPSASSSSLDSGSDEDYCPNPRSRENNLKRGPQQKYRHILDNLSKNTYVPPSPNSELLPKIINVYYGGTINDNLENGSSSEDDPEPLFLPKVHTSSNFESSNTNSYQVPEEREEECTSDIKVSFITTTNQDLCRIVKVRSVFKKQTPEERAKQLLLNKVSSVNMESKPSTSGIMKCEPSTSSTGECTPRLVSVRTVNKKNKSKRKK